MLIDTLNENLLSSDFSSPERYDSDLQRRVTTFLAARHRPSLRRLQVKATAGVVTLRGRVPTFHEKQLSIQLARRVAGVIRLIDEVAVHPAPGARCNPGFSRVRPR